MKNFHLKSLKTLKNQLENENWNSIIIEQH